MCCSVSRVVDRFGHSPALSAKAHEFIVERYGRSIRVQGSGPVGASCVPCVA